MYAVDSFEENGRLCLICRGEGITRDLHPKILRINSQEYKVKEVHVTEAFVGDLVVGFTVDGVKPVPLGQVEIVS